MGASIYTPRCPEGFRWRDAGINTRIIIHALAASGSPSCETPGSCTIPELSRANTSDPQPAYAKSLAPSNQRLCSCGCRQTLPPTQRHRTGGELQSPAHLPAKQSFGSPATCDEQLRTATHSGVRCSLTVPGCIIIHAIMSVSQQASIQSINKF